MKNVLLLFLTLAFANVLLAQSDVTFQVDMSEYAGTFTTVHVAGTFNNWGTDNTLSDDDMDGVWTGTLSIADGDHEFKFMVDSWADQETLVPGSSCTLTTGDFTNRIITVAGSTTLDEVCWGSCVDCGVVVQSAVTFSVDMSEYSGSFTTVYVSGTFNGWEGAANPLTDMGNGIWESTLTIDNGTIEYKFQVDAWTDQENFSPGGACTITTGDFTNRAATIEGDATLGTYCWNSCFACGAGPAGGMVTLSVDMSEFGGSFTTVYLSGAFNGWAGDANPLTDMGDGLWSGTVMMPGGANEYKFQVDAWADQENFVGGEPCTVTNGGFTNRIVQVDGDATVGTVCWNSCMACGGVVQDSVDITFNVNAEFISVDPSGLQLAGGAAFGIPGDFPMADDDMDGVWTITVRRPVGFSSFYTFTNGACADFSCKENIAGQDCANPGNFNDRFLPAVTQDTVINTCFAQCSTDGTCMEPANEVQVTLLVNMSEVDMVDPTGVFIGGAFENWSGSTAMTDDDGDLIYEATLSFLPGEYEYLFINGAGFAEAEDFPAFVLDTACTITTPDGMFTNRLLVVEAGDTQTTPIYCFNACDPCIIDNTTEVEVDHSMFELIPNLTAGGPVLVRFSEKAMQAKQKVLTVFDARGEQLQQLRLNGSESNYELNSPDWPQGLYFVQMRMDNAIGTQRLIIQK